MANYNQSVLTTAGLALANRAAKGLAKFKITRVTSTADVVGSSDIPELAKLPSEVQVGSITGQQPLADGDETVTGTKVLFTNHNLQTSYKINAVGLYATEDGKTEILYSVITAIEPEFMPDYGDQVLMEFGMTIYVVVGQVENMSIVVNPDSMATVAYVDKALADDSDKLKTDIQIIIDGGLTDVAKINEENTFTEVQKFDKGATDGKGNAYATTKDVATGLNNGLSTKVTDNHDGTEQLSGIQVQPYNKLSDVTSVRNIVLQTDNVLPYTAKGGIGELIQDFPLYSEFSSLPAGTTFYYSYDLNVTNSDGGVQWLGFLPWASFAQSKPITTDGIHHFQGIAAIPSKIAGLNAKIRASIDKSKATYQLMNLTIVLGSIPVTHLPAPEDKVNVADMRKPASDVAGIEEVNAKQDKLEYTPANAANTFHRSPDTGAVTESGNFPGLQVKGVDVATAADLKSVKDSAWRVLDNKYITAFTNYNTSIKVDEDSLLLVKIDEVNKRVYMFFTILGNFVENSSIYIDLTSIVKNLSFPSYHLYYLEGNTASSTADGSIVGNRICFKIQIYDTTVLNSKYSSYMVNANDAGWIYSSCFVSYDELV